MGTAVSKRKNLRNDAISSVAAKVRAARAFGEYLSHTHPENLTGSDHLLSDTFIGQDTESPDISCLHNNSLSPKNHFEPVAKTIQPQAQVQQTQPQSQAQFQLQAQAQPHTQVQIQPQLPPLPSSLQASASSKRRLSMERSLSSEEPPAPRGPEGKPARVYTITREGAMLGGQASTDTLELEDLKSSREGPLSQATANQQPRNHHRGTNSRGNHHRGAQSGSSQSQPLQSSGSTHNIRDWGVRRGGSREDCSPDCVTCIRAPCQTQRSLDLETCPRDGGKQRKKLERMYSEDRCSTEDREDNPNSWFPKENMFSFQTATTTMQAAFRGIAEKKRRKREQEATVTVERNFRKHLRMVGSRRVKVQTFAERRAKSFSRSWSDPTPVKPDPTPVKSDPTPVKSDSTPVKKDSLHDSRDSGDLQASSGALDEELYEDPDWEEEREAEQSACQGDNFIPPKIMLISSKVPKAEYVPNIIRRDDPSIIPILYDHEHATFDDIIEEIEKKLSAYRKGCRIWNMLIFCQGGPGHLYLLKNKVATFAKVEKEEDMTQFWRRLSRLMSKLNPEPNLIYIMGCYVLGSANGEKLIQNLKKMMKPYSIEFKSPLELSAQGKEMIEKYFDFRLFRLWKTRQQSKLLDYDDLL